MATTPTRRRIGRPHRKLVPPLDREVARVVPPRTGHQQSPRGPLWQEFSLPRPTIVPYEYMQRTLARRASLRQNALEKINGFWAPSAQRAASAQVALPGQAMVRLNAHLWGYTPTIFFCGATKDNVITVTVSCRPSTSTVLLNRICRRFLYFFDGRSLCM